MGSWRGPARVGEEERSWAAGCEVEVVNKSFAHNLEKKVEELLLVNFNRFFSEKAHTLPFVWRCLVSYVGGIIRLSLTYNASLMQHAYVWKVLHSHNKGYKGW